MRASRDEPSRSTPLRLPVAFGALVFVVLAVALSGCASSPPAGRASSDVAVGQCFALPTVEALGAATDNSPSVPCNAPHDAEVFRTFTYTGRYAKRSSRPLVEQLLGDVTKSCSSYTAIREYLGAGPLDEQWGVGVYPRVPTAKEWAAGVRTIRCDLVPDNITGVGPVVSAPLRGVLGRRDSARFRLCYRGKNPLTCNLPHDVEVIAGEVVLPSGPYPSPNVLLGEASAACTPPVTSYLANSSPTGMTSKPRLPGRATWNQGDRRVRCAIGPILTDDLVTGTLRGGLA